MQHTALYYRHPAGDTLPIRHSCRVPLPTPVSLNHAELPSGEAQSQHTGLVLLTAFPNTGRRAASRAYQLTSTTNRSAILPTFVTLMRNGPSQRGVHSTTQKLVVSSSLPINPPDSSS